MSMANKQNKISTPSESGKQPAKPERDYRKAFTLRYKHQLSIRDISDLTNIPRSTLEYAFKPIDKLLKNDGSLELYSNNKPEILNAIEFELLSDLSDAEKRKKASLNNTAYAFQQIHMARRLEQGLSTGNLAVNVEKTLQTAHEKAQKQRDKLRDTAE